MKPLAIDLFCGMFGWSQGWLELGGEVVGFDLEHHAYHGAVPPNASLVLQDVRTLHGSQFKDASLILASSPCQEFSYRAMPWKRAKALGPPVLGMELFAQAARIQQEAIAAAGASHPDDPGERAGGAEMGRASDVELRELLPLGRRAGAHASGIPRGEGRRGHEEQRRLMVQYRLPRAEGHESESRRAIRSEHRRESGRRHEGLRCTARPKHDLQAARLEVQRPESCLSGDRPNTRSARPMDRAGLFPPPRAPDAMTTEAKRVVLPYMAQHRRRRVALEIFQETPEQANEFCRLHEEGAKQWGQKWLKINQWVKLRRGNRDARHSEFNATSPDVDAHCLSALCPTLRSSTRYSQRPDAMTDAADVLPCATCGDEKGTGMRLTGGQPTRYFCTNKQCPDFGTELVLAEWNRRFARKPLPRTVERYGSPFPRRNCVDQYAPEEAAIWKVHAMVEAMPASVHMTDAVILLAKAADRVADYLEGVPEPASDARAPGPALASAMPSPEELLDVLVDVSQLFDGWHGDGTAWTTWDEDVRKRLAALNLRLDALRGAVHINTRDEHGVSQPTSSDLAKAVHQAAMVIRLLGLGEGRTPGGNGHP